MDVFGWKLGEFPPFFQGNPGQKKDFGPDSISTNGFFTLSLPLVIFPTKGA